VSSSLIAIHEVLVVTSSENSFIGSSVSVQVFRFDGESTGEFELLVGLNTSRDPRGSLGNDGLVVDDDVDDDDDGDFFRRFIAK
ncbi:hypothetical protein A2U01_0048424, partial [Trifolium medium]|nr:hypothetical protein [Trifolium medium]